MAKIIRSLYDKEGNSVLPITSISAIFDSNGVRLDKLLDGFGIASDQFEDFEPKEDGTQTIHPSLPIALKNIKSGTGISTALSYTKAALLDISETMDILANSIGEKTKTLTFYTTISMKNWVDRNKSLLNKGDFLLVTRGKDYWWDGENIVPITANVTEDQINEWSSTLDNAKAYTDEVFKDLVNIDIKIIQDEKLPSIGEQRTLYLWYNDNKYKQYMYTTKWIQLSEIDLNLEGICDEKKVNEIVEKKLEDLNISSIISNCSSVNLSFAEKGWYRIAKFEGYTNITHYGSLSNGLNILIKKQESNTKSELFDVNLISTNTDKQFTINYMSTYIDQTITTLRIVYDTQYNVAYLELYYDSNDPNSTFITINDNIITYSNKTYKWEIFDHLELGIETGNTIFEVCSIDLTKKEDLQSTVESNKENIKKLTSLVEQLLNTGGSGEISISSSIGEEDKQSLKKELEDELYPIGSYSLLIPNVGTWTTIASFDIEEDNNVETVTIYKRLT